jgi:hypothetical protein
MVVTSELEVDAVLTRRDQVVHHMDDSNTVPWLEDPNIADSSYGRLLPGTGRGQAADQRGHHRAHEQAAS